MAAYAVIGLGGIGDVVARQLLDAGHQVIAGRHRSGAPGDSPYCELAIDVTNYGSCRDFFGSARRRVGRVSGVVNCFGSLHVAPALSQSWDEAASNLFDTHVGGVVNVSRAAASTFVKAGGGAIVNFASVAAQHALAGLALYGSAKAAVIAFTRSFAFELAQQRVRANVIAPGYVDAGLTAELDAKLRALMSSHVPMQRMATADEVAAMVCYLLSDEARYVTGQTFVIDGGLSIGPRQLMTDMQTLLAHQDTA